MRHTQFGASSRAAKGRTRAVVLALVALLLIAFGSIGACSQPAAAPNTRNMGNGCPTGQELCNGVCVDLKSSATNCGTCGTACTSGGLCANGACGCQVGLTKCPSGACVNPMSDGANCGACGNVCGAGLLCSLGTCSATCASGLMPCGNSCVNTATEIAHCGACNRPCGAGLGCANGMCACPGTQRDCGTGCIDPASNGSHCGTCGNVCGTGMTCTNSACVCPPGVTCGPPGTGGTPNAGGAGGTSGGTSGAGGTGGTGGSGGCGTTGEVEGGGYITNGSWHGYGFTAAVDGATITTAPSAINPSNFGTVTNFPLCASGSVSNSYDSLAMIGLNLNEAINDDCGEMNPKMTVTPQLDGIYLQLRNPGLSQLRIQIQSPMGALPGVEGEDYRWCATVSGTGGFIPFSSFTLRCWAGGMNQTPYAGQPIDSILLMVPGDIAAAITYDFCIDGLLEADDMGPPPGTGCQLNLGPGEGGGTITGTDTRNVTRGGRGYVVQNNVWNSAVSNQNQTLNVTGTGFTITEQGNSMPTTGAPTGFPSVFIGSNHGHASASSGLPRQVSSLTDVPTGWRISGVSGETNAAYDVWFSTGAGGDAGNPSGGYLMVWYHDPPAAQPLGQPTGTESLNGRSWQVWTCPGACQNGVPVISYVPTGGTSITEMSFDLNDFIQNAVTDYPSFVNPSWYLTNVFAGFEVWSGGLNARSHEFCAEVE